MSPPSSSCRPACCSVCCKSRACAREFAQGLRVVGGDHGRDAMIARHFEADFNPAQFRRIKPQLEARVLAVEAADDLAPDLLRPQAPRASRWRDRQAFPPARTLAATRALRFAAPTRLAAAARTLASPCSRRAGQQKCLSAWVAVAAVPAQPRAAFPPALRALVLQARRGRTSRSPSTDPHRSPKCAPRFASRALLQRRALQARRRRGRQRVPLAVWWQFRCSQQLASQPCQRTPLLAAHPTSALRPSLRSASRASRSLAESLAPPLVRRQAPSVPRELAFPLAE